MGFLTPDATGEHDVLATYTLHQLAQLRTTVFGLTDEEAASTPTASALNLITLLRHCGSVAVFWSASALSAPRPPVLPEDMQEDPSLESLLADPIPLADALAFFDRCVAIASDNLAAIADLAAPVPVPDSPWIPEDLLSWEARWCLAHIATEIARHAGHADLIREAIDGRGSYELNDLAEGGADL